MKKLIITSIIWVMILCMSSCSLLSSDKKDLEPKNKVVMDSGESGDPDDPKPDRDE